MQHKTEHEIEADKSQPVIGIGRLNTLQKTETGPQNKLTDEVAASKDKTEHHRSSKQ